MSHHPALTKAPFHQIFSVLRERRRGQPYWDLVETLIKDHPRRWKELGEFLGQGWVGEEIVRADRVRMFWDPISREQTLSQAQWERGARSLMEGLGPQKNPSHLAEQLVRGARTIQGAVRTVGLVKPYLLAQGGAKQENAFWMACGDFLLNWAMDDESPQALEQLLTYTHAGQGLGHRGTMTWPQVWVLVRANAERGETDVQILEHLVTWGANLEATNEGCSLLTLACRLRHENNAQACRSNIEALLSAGADPETLDATGLGDDVKAWIRLHPVMVKQRLLDVARDTHEAVPGRAPRL